jgi:predicted PolB exonuclease-like 3'-5' exonuclease
MFKTIQPLMWAFDAEWAPDPRAGRVLYHLPDDLPDAEVVVEMWRRGGATEEEPMPFLKTIHCRVLSIAAIQRKVKNNEVELNLLWLPRDVSDEAQQTEKSIIGTFLQAIGKHHPQLVGYNSHSADLKILVQRAVVNGLSAPDFCRRPDKPWEGTDYFGRGSESNIDLLDILGSWGKAGASLNDVAALSGIPGKFETAGEEVAKMWLTGQWREIIEYNCFDALTTYLVWLRLAHFGGHLTTEQYEEEQELARHSIMEWTEKPELHFLEKYLEEWDRLQHATGQL